MSGCGFADLCMDDPFLRAYGFRANTQESSLYFMDYQEKSRKWIHITNFLSWFPILSLISAAYHFYLADQMKQKALNKVGGNGAEEKNFHYYALSLKIRAVSEICQASLFLAAFDIIVSLARLYALSQWNKKQSPP